MITKITKNNINIIKNTGLRAYAAIYADIYENFLADVSKTGIQIDEKDHSSKINSIKAELKAAGVTVRNGGKSVVYGNISGACLDCRTGKGTATFIISLKCNRDCYFCANKNQSGYAITKDMINDINAEFRKSLSIYGKMSSVAVTGGEPLLFVNECISFVSHVKKTDRKIQVRIYSNGDLADKNVIKALANAGLDEIRIGVKLDDNGKAPVKVMENLKDMVGVIPRVMVEMPVIPGTLEAMKDFLDELNSCGIYGINLLEFLYPFNHATDFTKYGHKVLNRPYQVLYAYTYAGGLPILGSELECLQLLKYAFQQKHSMGVHYCSLENKLSAQIWHQNNHFRKAPYEYFSPNDFFVKTAIACGEDAERIEKILKNKGNAHYKYDKNNRCIDFSVHDISCLKSMNLEVGLSYRVLESEHGKEHVREVAIDLVDINNFDINMI